MKRLAVLLFLLLAPPAHADLTVSTSTTQAGANADVTIEATFDATPDSVRLSLPPGLVGNPNAAPRCSLEAFRSLVGCPPAAQVGTAGVNGLPLGQIFNLEPQPGEPARLGIAFLALVKNEASISLRPDGGLDSTIARLETGGLPVSSMQLTLSDEFMTLPTSCVPATITLNGQSASFTPTGCETVPFRPSLSAALETARRAAPTGATVTLALPEGDAHVRRAVIALPVGTTLNPGVANGLQACTAAQFAQTCPAASQVGSVSFVTPLLGELGGKVFFGENFRLYIVVEGEGVLVKLAGDVRLDPATGQITTVFDGLPQVPFTRFALSFQGGPRAVLANPTACGTRALSAALTPWSGSANRTATATFTVNQSCAVPPLTPELRVGADSTAAGRPAGAVTMEITRPDGAPDIRRVTTELPPGLAGSLKGVPVCPEAPANAGACPADTLVGAVSALAGGGEAPVALSGTVALTGPVDGGLAGLAIAIPGRVGPVDLGTVVVRASISLRPDGGLSVRTSPMPALVGGVPVSIRRLTFSFNRPGFILNSSSCAPQQIAAVLEGSDGSQATATAPYQAGDCAGLAFAPRLEATIGSRGRTRAGAFAPLRATITVPAGHAATANAEVSLPRAISVDLKRLNRACAPGAAACPPSSRIGSAVATTPLLDAPLTSPVTLAIPAPGELPGLALELTGPVSLPLFGKVDIFRGDGRIHNRFAGIPDVPLERFDLAFTRSSPLRLKRDVCRGPRQYVTGTLTGHNGTAAKLRARLKVEGCPPRLVLKRRTLRVKRGRDAAKIRTVRVNRKRYKPNRRVRLRAGKRYRVTVVDRERARWRFTVRVPR